MRLHVGHGIAALACVATLIADPVRAAGLSDSLEVVSATNRSAAESQEKIDRLSRETRALLEEYRRLQDGTEYQAAYTRELEELEAVQQQRIADLREQIAQARITRQRIVPLMRSMADALERFVALDLPFRQEERLAAVLTLKQRLQQPDLALAARFRLLLEAYQVEQGYGGSIEAWRDVLNRDGEQRSVDYLRLGRVALYYQTLDGSASGYWHAGEERWETLDPRYNRALSQALHVARNLNAPQLLTLPMLTPGSGP